VVRVAPLTTRLSTTRWCSAKAAIGARCVTQRTCRPAAVCRDIRRLPIFGLGANDVSPRAGHLHVTVDDLPWHWADAGNTGSIVVAGLPAGDHKVLIELATPEHRVITGRAMTFTVPAVGSSHH